MKAKKNITNSVIGVVNVASIYIYVQQLNKHIAII